MFVVLAVVLDIVGVSVAWWLIATRRQQHHRAAVLTAEPTAVAMLDLFVAPTNGKVPEPLANEPDLEPEPAKVAVDLTAPMEPSERALDLSILEHLVPPRDSPGAWVAAYVLGEAPA